jgi:hypothetical protein
MNSKELANMLRQNLFFLIQQDKVKNFYLQCKPCYNVNKEKNIALISFWSFVCFKDKGKGRNEEQ